MESDGPAPDPSAGVDAVVHLAGTSIAGRFTPEHKAAIRDSRIEPTRRLAELAAAAVRAPLFAHRPSVTTVSTAATRCCVRTACASGRRRRRLGGRGRRSRRRGLGCGWLTVRTGDAAGAAAHCGDAPLFAAGSAGASASRRQWLSWIGVDDLDHVHRALYDARRPAPSTPAPTTGAQPRLHEGAGGGAAPPGGAVGAIVRCGAPVGGQGARELAEPPAGVVPTGQVAGAGHRFLTPAPRRRAGSPTWVRLTGHLGQEPADQLGLRSAALFSSSAARERTSCPATSCRDRRPATARAVRDPVPDAAQAHGRARRPATSWRASSAAAGVALSDLSRQGRPAPDSGTSS